MSQETFDLAAWKSQGEDAFKALENREKELEHELEQIRNEKEILAIGLGKKLAVKPRRIRIRPTIVEILNTSGNGSMRFESLWEQAKERLPEVKEESVRVSVQRLCADNTRYAMSGNDITIAAE